MKMRQLGRGGPSISAVGLGCMVMSGGFGQATEHDSIATMHRALEIGVNFFDTADICGLGGNETLVGKALKGHRDACVLATKFGNAAAADVVLGIEDLQRLDDAFAPGAAAAERMNPGRRTRAG